MSWTSLAVTLRRAALLKRDRALAPAGACSITPQWFSHTSLSDAVKLLSWCLYGASPLQGTVGRNTSFEVLMCHLYADTAGARGELGRAGHKCRGLPAQLPAGSCCHPLSLALDQEPKVWTELCCIWCLSAFSLFNICSGAGSRATSAPPCWKCRV